MIRETKMQPSAADVILDRARHFLQDHLVPNAPRWGQGEFEPKALFKPAGAAGLLGLLVPREFGGSALSFRDKVLVLQTLAQGDFSAAMALVNSHNVIAQLVQCSPDVLAPRYVQRLLAGDAVACTALTEPGTGSDLAQLQTMATRSGDGWILNGSKTWIINAAHADHVVVYAQTHPGAGVKGIGAFLVHTNAFGFKRIRVATNSALSSMGLGGFELNNVYCEHSHLMYAPGAAFADIMSAINRARTYVAAMCCATVSQALADASAHGHRRHVFGKALEEHQGWRWQLAQAATALEAGQLLVEHACALIDRGADARTAAAQAKLYASSMAQTQLGALLQAMGAEGFLDRYAFLRHLTAAHSASLADGSTAMLLERVAQDISFKPGVN